MTDSELINWVANRFIRRYNEDKNVDFILAIRRISTRLKKYGIANKRV